MSCRPLAHVDARVRRGCGALALGVRRPGEGPRRRHRSPRPHEGPDRRAGRPGARRARERQDHPGHGRHRGEAGRRAPDRRRRHPRRHRAAPRGDRRASPRSAQAAARPWPPRRSARWAPSAATSASGRGAGTSATRASSCFKRGGRQCFAIPGNNRTYFSVLGLGVCVMSHPSDLAPALIALGARVGIAGPGGRARGARRGLLPRTPQPDGDGARAGRDRRVGRRAAAGARGAEPLSQAPGSK